MNIPRLRAVKLAPVVTCCLGVLSATAVPALASGGSDSVFRSSSHASLHGVLSTTPHRGQPLRLAGGRYRLSRPAALPASVRSEVAARIVHTAASRVAPPKVGAAVTSASLKMKLPSAFTQQSGGTATQAWDDNINNNFFDLFHTATKPYAKDAIQGGYHQEALTNVHVKNDAQAYWLGAYADTTKHAAALVQDSVDVLTKGSVKFTDYSCTNFTDNCHLFEVGLTDQQNNQYAVIFAIWYTKNVVGEAALLTDLNTANSYSNAYANRFVQLIQAGVIAVYASLGETPPPVRITSFVLLHKHNGELLATSKLHLNEFAVFIGTYQSSASGNQTAALTVFKGGKSIFSTAMSTGQLSDGTPAFLAAGAFEASSALGNLTVKVTVRVGTASATTSIQVTVVK